MAQIDLKNAFIFIRDGYAGVDNDFQVNNGAGYSGGATTILVDTGTGAVVTNDLFNVVGSVSGGYLVKHKVTSHIETLGNTTSITFTPGLGAAIVDNALITFLPHELEVKIGEGNLTWSEKKNMEYVKNRGNLDTVSEGDKEPVDLKIDATWEFIKASTGLTPTINDVLKKRGEAASWVSSSSDACEPYAVDIVVEYLPPCVGFLREIITFSDFRYESLDHDLREGQISCSGKCNITEPIVVRL